MTEPKRPLKVFLCHAHADRDPVRGLYTRLTQDGVDAWLDKEKLLPGQDWELEIRKAVREADVVVVCLSKQFNQAGFRQKEVRLALDTAMEQPEGEIFIIPARLEECETLESLRKWHWVDLFEENGYEMLMRAFRARADKIGTTLQIKKNWLPNVTSSRNVQNKPIIIPHANGQEVTPEIKKPKRKWNPKQIIVNLALIALGVTGVLAFALPIFNPPAQSAEPTPETTQPQTIITVTNTKSAEPSKTLTPKPTSTPTSTLTPTPFPTEITDSKGVTMRLVPVGEFTMGSENGDSDEKPVHQVYLDAFYMDKYEVTISLYKVCEDSGFCTVPYTSYGGYTNYYGSSKFGTYPVTNVTWEQARGYCEWRNADLPTEAQWEKAARGIDGRTYPWGEASEGTIIDCSKANYHGCRGDLTNVGSYESGKSPYDIYDLGGNVWEWVADWYSETYYQVSSKNNPSGPVDGDYKVLRGSSWWFYDNNARTSDRLEGSLLWRNYSNEIGFRCAKDATP